MIGRQIQGYLVQEKIRDGSTGTVWRVLNPERQVFALKQMSPEHAARGENAGRFEREAALAQSLVHPGILRVHGTLDCAPPAVVMEYFESENLKYALWNCPERIVKHEFRILRQVAEALSYAHARGVIHGDLRPENVFVNAGQETRLTGFSQTPGRSDRNPAGRREEGSPLYRSPEQIRGEICDARSDVYSFGAMTYELLTRRPPFLGTTPQALEDKHLKEVPASLRTWVPTLSEDLDRVVLRMLAKRKEDRGHDLRKVLQELTGWEKKDTVVRVRQLGPLRDPRSPRP